MHDRSSNGVFVLDHIGEGKQWGAPLLWPASTGSAVCIPGQQLTAEWAESCGCELLASASELDLCLHPGPDHAGPEQHCQLKG